MREVTLVLLTRLFLTAPEKSSQALPGLAFPVLPFAGESVTTHGRSHVLQRVWMSWRRYKSLPGQVQLSKTRFRDAGRGLASTWAVS